jgi:hypothetical protein
MVQLPKKDDRVRRASGIGCAGTVLSVSIPVTLSSFKKPGPDDYLIKILWDNGTESYVSAGALEIL